MIELEIRIGRNQRIVILEFYGIFQGHEFGPSDLTQKNISRVLCLHDAPHSVSLFLQEKDSCQFAMHSTLPFQFPGAKQYVINYTQKYDYPLVILKYGESPEDMLAKNGMPTKFRRWCTRVYKIEMARFFYKHFALNGITQVKGMTKHQSSKRSKMIPGIIEDPMSQKRFTIYQELPIFEMTEETQLEMMKKENIETPDYFDKYGMHGCMMCPFRCEKYYYELKEKDPEYYAQCQSWRSMGSTEEKQYYYFRKSKIM